MPSPKQEVITFKVDSELAEALQSVPNRSRFIRQAVLAAISSVCPVCMGAGVLTPSQREHWEAFARRHAVVECPDCHQRHLTCDLEKHP